MEFINTYGDEHDVILSEDEEVVCLGPGMRHTSTKRKSQSILQFLPSLCPKKMMKKMAESEKLREGIDAARSEFCKYCSRSFRSTQYLRQHRCIGGTTSSVPALHQTMERKNNTSSIAPFMTPMCSPLIDPLRAQREGREVSSSSTSIARGIANSVSDSERGRDDEDEGNSSQGEEELQEGNEDCQNISQKHRKQYTVSYKQRAVRLFNEIAKIHPNARQLTASTLGLDPTLLSRWKVQVERNGIASKRSSSTTASRRFRCSQHKTLAAFPREEERVLQWFRECRKQGMGVSGRMIRIRMKSEVAASTLAKALQFKASEKWLRTFVKRHKLSWRVKTNTKSMSLEDRIPRIRRWHARLRRRLGKDDPILRRHPKWGRWDAENRYNLDQVHMPNAMLSYCV